MKGSVSSLLLVLGISISRPFAEPPLVEIPRVELEAVENLAAIESRGGLRFAVPRGTLSYFLHEGEARGFELELLRRFAKLSQLRVVTEVTENPVDAAQLLARGEVDIAVLPWTDAEIHGATRIEEYVVPRGAESDRTYPATGALFVRADNGELTTRLARYLDDQGGGRDLRILHRRYFARPGRFRLHDAQPRISRFDDLIAKHSTPVGFDWRLVAALIYEESRFDPQAVSHKGAAGLMQLMPFVVTEIGIADPHHPESSIAGGVRHLRWISGLFPNAEGEDLMALTMAAYLMGPAHVTDGQRLAIELGTNPNRWWGELELVLPLLERREHYRDARYGYAPGTQAVRYVRRIFQRYRHYRNHVGIEPGQAAAIDRDRTRQTN